MALAPPSGTIGNVKLRSQYQRDHYPNVESSQTSNALVRDIREANKMRLSKLEMFEENQRQLSLYRDIKMKEDLAKREAEMLGML